VAERHANKIAKVTTSGAFTEYDIPTSNSITFLIAAGADGNLWFVETGGHKVARLTTSGVIREFAVPPAPTGGTFPAGIASGPDGNMWIADGENRVIKILPRVRGTSQSPPQAPGASRTPIRRPGAGTMSRVSRTAPPPSSDRSPASVGRNYTRLI
jgi:streptogramin lyase